VSFPFEDLVVTCEFSDHIGPDKEKGYSLRIGIGVALVGIASLGVRTGTFFSLGQLDLG
jgi:hypothetical protein